MRGNQKSQNQEFWGLDRVSLTKAMELQDKSVIMQQSNKHPCILSAKTSSTSQVHRILGETIEKCSLCQSESPSCSIALRPWKRIWRLSFSGQIHCYMTSSSRTWALWLGHSLHSQSQKRFDVCWVSAACYTNKCTSAAETNLFPTKEMIRVISVLAVLCS